MKFNKSELLTASNLLSALRALLVIPLWILMDNLSSSGMRYTVGGLLIFAAVTDILDGWAARKYNQVTEAGKIIDPLADKIIVGALVIKLYLLNEVPDYYIYMILGRDLLILIGGIIVTRKIGKVLPSNVLGKITVVFISFSLLFMLLGVDRSSIFFLILYYSSLFLVVFSLIGYIIRALEFIKKSENESVQKLQF
jgi:CDP-diacylglycerol--glycerol-3-phosphate 3-phosphatidyltransferase